MDAAWQRLFNPLLALEHSFTVAVSVGLIVLLAVAPWLVRWLAARGTIDEPLRAELMLRIWSWCIIVPAILIPILLGAAWTILGVGLLSLLCYREYARATGLFRHKLESLVVVLGILAVTLAALDHWYTFFMALAPLSMGAIAIAAILRDRPEGYIQRVALAVFGFALFGSCLGHLGYLANDAGYRPVLILLFLSVGLNDVFAFLAGKTLGRRKLAPRTSPNKTVEGALGAIVLTTALVVLLGQSVFAGSVLVHPAHLIALGVLISVLGQFGDLMLSSIKRDLGIKDMARTIPGHGGLLDRFDSLILVAPAVFHYMNYFVGVGLQESPYVLSGGWHWF